jgi:hypothetical protein
MKSWKAISLAGLFAIGVSVWSGAAQAQYSGGNVYQREAIQERQIQEGMRTGSLTPQEAARLEAEQRRIRETEARMRADGRLDPRERRRLERMQEKAERDIYREKHDKNVAYPNYGNQYERGHRHWQDTHRPD